MNKKTVIKKFLFFLNINMLGLSLYDLKLVAESLSLDDSKLIAKRRGIKSYNNMCKEKLLSALSKSKIYNERLKKIREDFNKSRQKLSKSEIKEIRKNIYEVESKKQRGLKKVFLRLKNIMIMMMLNT